MPLPAYVPPFCSALCQGEITAGPPGQPINQSTLKSCSNNEGTVYSTETSSRTPGQPCMPYGAIYPRHLLYRRPSVPVMAAGACSTCCTCVCMQAGMGAGISCMITAAVTCLDVHPLSGPKRPTLHTAATSPTRSQATTAMQTYVPSRRTGRARV